MAKCKYSKDCVPKQDGVADCEHCRETTNPKPKFKKIKAVAAINREGEMYSIRHEIDSDKWDKRVWKPCTILINAKYLKGEK